ISSGDGSRTCCARSWVGKRPHRGEKGAAMARAPYKAKSLKGAERRVREQQKVIERLMLLGERYARDRRLLAKLAADTPQFDNPLAIFEAKKIRDEILSGRS